MPFSSGCGCLPVPGTVRIGDALECKGHTFVWCVVDLQSEMDFAVHPSPAGLYEQHSIDEIRTVVIREIANGNVALLGCREGGAGLSCGRGNKASIRDLQVDAPGLWVLL